MQNSSDMDVFNLFSCIFIDPHEEQKYIEREHSCQCKKKSAEIVHALLLCWLIRRVYPSVFKHAVSKRLVKASNLHQIAVDANDVLKTFVRLHSGWASSNA